MRFNLRLSIYSLLAGFAAGFAGQLSAAIELPPSTSQTYPYNLIGRVITRLGTQEKVATGSLASRGVLLTVADVLFDPNTGFATDIKFERGRNGGTVIENATGRVVVLLRQFTESGDTATRLSSNVGGVLFARPPANGRSEDLRATRALLDNTTSAETVGYSLNQGNGRRMLSTAGGFSRVPGSSLLFTPISGERFNAYTKGGPVFRLRVRNGVLQYLMVAIIVDRGIARGFSASEVRTIEGFLR